MAESKKKRKWLYITVGAVVSLTIIIAVTACGGEDSGEATTTMRGDEVTTTQGSAETTEAAGGTTTTAAETTTTAAPETTTTAAGAETFPDGQYLVGTDIPAGLYKGTTTGALGGYWGISTDANSTDIVANEITVGPFYVEVTKGQYLQLTSVEIVDASTVKVETPATKDISDGAYLVGTDIAAGKYKGITTGAAGGYWGISTDANSQDIVTNALTTGDFYVDVTKGQYLRLSGVTIGQLVD